MGRDLVETGRGWCFKETVSEAYGRVSKFFKTKEDALQCLTDNGYHPQLIEMLRETEHVPSIIATSQGMYPCGLALDRCLSNAGRQRGGRYGEMTDMLQSFMNNETPPNHGEE